MRWQLENKIIILLFLQSIRVKTTSSFGVIRWKKRNKQLTNILELSYVFQWFPNVSKGFPLERSLMINSENCSRHSWTITRKTCTCEMTEMSMTLFTVRASGTTSSRVHVCVAAYEDGSYEVWSNILIFAVDLFCCKFCVFFTRKVLFLYYMKFEFCYWFLYPHLVSVTSYWFFRDLFIIFCVLTVFSKFHSTA